MNSSPPPNKAYFINRGSYKKLQEMTKNIPTRLYHYYDSDKKTHVTYNIIKITVLEDDKVIVYLLETNTNIQHEITISKEQIDQKNKTTTIEYNYFVSGITIVHGKPNESTTFEKIRILLYPIIIHANDEYKYKVNFIDKDSYNIFKEMEQNIPIQSYTYDKFDEFGKKTQVTYTINKITVSENDTNDTVIVELLEDQILHIITISKQIDTENKTDTIKYNYFVSGITINPTQNEPNPTKEYDIKFLLSPIITYKKNSHDPSKNNSLGGSKLRKTRRNKTRTPRKHRRKSVRRHSTKHVKYYSGIARTPYNRNRNVVA